SDEDSQLLARRLMAAASGMDEAPITTIHGFALRATQESAFESVLPFDRGEQIDDAAGRVEPATDYWRRQVIGQRPEVAQPFCDLWPSPDDLEKEIRDYLIRAHTRIAGPEHDEIVKRAVALRKLWKKGKTRLKADLKTFVEAGRLNKKELKVALEKHNSDIDAFLSEIDAALSVSSTAVPALPAWAVHLADSRQFSARGNAAKQAAATFVATELVRKLVAFQPLYKLDAVRQAKHQISSIAARRKQERRQFSFDDMIGALHEAITHPESGQALADALHKAWPWALVDEFQDTDPLQYEILRRIYAKRTHGGLMLIGDPKQAIYGFRSGDIFAYLQAVDDVADRYGLTTNFRSTRGLLNAFAAIFKAPGKEAFLVADIEFHDVLPGPHADDRTLTIEGAPVPPFTLWPFADAKNSAKSKIHPAIVNATVSRITRLLSDNAQAKFVTATDGTETSRTVQPRDIAVLVNTNREAAWMQRELSANGIASVCLHQQCVFEADETQEANDLRKLLRAAASPTDEGLVRTALCTPLLGFHLRDMVRLAGEHTEWQTTLDRFQSAHARWQSTGVLSMLYSFLQSAAPRLLACDNGDRRMSNYMQLAELLATAESETFGMTGLIGWLRDTIAEASAAGEQAQLRLESDEALVRIVTVHRAKGLQYPIVFLPFAPWLGAGGKPDQPAFYFHEKGQAYLCPVLLDEAHKRQSVREARAEGLRLLYVALTRAEQAVFMPWGLANSAQNGALAGLLVRDLLGNMETWYWSGNCNPLDEAAIRKAIATLTSSCNSIEVELLPVKDESAAFSPPLQALPGRARTDLPQRRPPWGTYSFSRLVRYSGAALASRGASDEAASEVEQIADGPAQFNMQGAAFGNALHDVLEKAELANWPGPTQTPAVEHGRLILHCLRRHGFVVDETDSDDGAIANCARLVSNTLHTPLPGIGTLAVVPAAQRVAEMEFMMRLGGMSPDAVIRLLDWHGYGSPLSLTERSEALTGLMHGFIDLVVESGGRYYVIDYKTNNLGLGAEAYAIDNLRNAMRLRHYDLQYLIYVVSLHRYLGIRIPGYTPETHLGGVRYLFMRGMSPDAGARGIFSDRPDPEFIRLLDAAFDGQARAA
nr:UvrD-helicase domain-containing protein [Gammaproteobacteria bacterium]